MHRARYIRLSILDLFRRKSRTPKERPAPPELTIVGRERPPAPERLARRQSHRIVLLAASRRPGGLCYAGKELRNVVVDEEGLVVQADIGDWIRPVPSNHGGLPPESMNLRFGQGPAKPLDVIEIDLVGPAPHGHQVENWIVGRSQPQRIATWPTAWLSRLRDEPATLWSNELSSSQGICNYITAEQAARVDGSLYLIELGDPHFRVQNEYRGELKCRVHFTYGDRRYLLTVTDPDCEAKLLARGPGHYRFAAAGPLYACISLGAEFDGRHYKLAAGILSSGSTL